MHMVELLKSTIYLYVELFEKLDYILVHVETFAWKVYFTSEPQI